MAPCLGRTKKVETTLPMTVVFLKTIKIISEREFHATLFFMVESQIRGFFIC